MTKRATLNQVAQYAGVSIATASRSFSNPELVKPETVTRIRLAATALNYKAPRLLERDLSMLRVAVFTRLFNHQGEMERLRGISNALRAWPHEMLFYDLDDSLSSIDYVKKLVVTKRVEGLIFVGVPLAPEVAAYLTRFQMPTVLIENDDSRFSRVISPDNAGSELVADFFNKSQALKILFVGSRPVPMDINPGIRLKSFRDRLNRHQNEIIAEFLFDPMASTIHEELIKVLKSKKRPNAVFADSDYFAAAVFKAATSVGLSIPKDLLLVGYGDTDLAQQLDFSSVRIHLDASGRRAIEILRSMENGDANRENRSPSEVPIPIREELVPELIHRGSTRNERK